MVAADESVLTPNDLREASGLTPRQVNDWDSRGALPNDRDAAGGHRRFTVTQVFAIAVSAALRTQFGIPLERLQFVQRCLLDEDGDGDGDAPYYLNLAARTMAETGLGVWLATDLDEVVLVLSEMEYADLWTIGAFGAKKNSFVFLNLNPIVNKIMTAIGRSPIESHERYREMVMAFRTHDRATFDGEREVLAMIRSGNYRTIEVTSRDGEVHTVTSTKDLGKDADLSAVLDSEEFQQVTSHVRHGKVAGYTQSATKTFSKGAPKRADDETTGDARG